MAIRMIVSDLDGTLINSDKLGTKLSPDLVASIKHLQESGKIFTIATGRSEISCLSIIKELEIQAPFIAYNGACILSPDGNYLYTSCFPLKKWLTFLQGVQVTGSSIIFNQNNQIYYFEETQAIRAFQAKENTFCRKAEVDIIEAAVVNKILLIGDVEAIKKQWHILPEEIKTHYRYLESEDNYLEIVKAGVSKGQALKFIKNYLNINDDEVLAIGNHLNDLELLLEAHIGVAVANAQKNLKEIADYVTEGEFEQGVIEVINKYK